MELKSAAGTHVGKIRTNNEDNYFLNGVYKKDICENIRSDESEEQKKRITKWRGWFRELIVNLIAIKFT